MSLRGELASMTDEEAAELIRAVCPRAAVLVVAEALDEYPRPSCWSSDPGPHAGRPRVRVCDRILDGFCDACCDAHACEGSL